MSFANSGSIREFRIPEGTIDVQFKMSFRSKNVFEVCELFERQKQWFRTVDMSKPFLQFIHLSAMAKICFHFVP